MKILFLSNSIGGLINFRKEFIEKLCFGGHEIHISSPIETSTEYFESLGCIIHVLKMSQRGTNPKEEFLLLQRYKKIIKSVTPDIVLSYTIKPNIYGSVACSSYNIPIITSVTGLGTAVENGGWLQKLSVSLLKWGLSKANHVFFQNKESMDFFREKKIKLKSQSLVPGSGVNLEKFAFSEYPDEKDGVKFLFTGRILEPKGIKLYLKAASELIKKYPTAQFHIVGIKDDPELSKLVEEYHEKGIVIFHGQQKDVRPFISDVHCQVHPTFYPEGMSNVLLESAAMGRPAITTDRSGCKEIVDNELTGFIIPQRSKDALVKSMSRFIQMGWKEKKNMGELAHLKIKQQFDRTNVIRIYEDKIRELTGGII